jgi:hypothetical protein
MVRLYVARSGRIRGMAKFKPGDRVMKVDEWVVYTVHEIISEPGVETWYSLQKDANFTRAKESELEAELAPRIGIRSTSKGRKVGKLSRPIKVKEVNAHLTHRRRALKKDHNPKSKGTGKTIRYK